MIFTAAGDYLGQRRLPPDYAGFDRIVKWIRSGDARFFNLETTLHREGECFGFTNCGGSYLRADPEILEDCKRFGFNMISFCNNHTMDFAYGGMLKTLEHVSRSGMIHAGVGKNLDQAAAPAYLDARGGRVALIAMTSSGPNGSNDVCMAGRQSRRVSGRPGTNQLRCEQTLVVTPEQMAQIQQIAAATGINASEDISRKEGYRDLLPEGCFKLDSLMFRTGETTCMDSRCHTADLARVDRAISEARFQADYILVSIHSHQAGGAKEVPAPFLVEFARHCIDQGADAVIGHGPHLLRPVKIYRGKPIFYSLGDFVIQNENIPFSPEDYYEGKGLTSDDTMGEVFRRRSRNFACGLQTNPLMFIL